MTLIMRFKNLKLAILLKSWWYSFIKYVPYISSG